jgi:hypothetical protein
LIFLCALADLCEKTPLLFRPYLRLTIAGGVQMSRQERKDRQGKSKPEFSAFDFDFPLRLGGFARPYERRTAVVSPR